MTMTGTRDTGDIEIRSVSQRSFGSVIFGVAQSIYADKVYIHSKSTAIKAATILGVAHSNT